MISSHLEDADLERRVASWAASASSDDAAAVRAVIEAYGGRLAAADVAEVVSQHTGDAAVMQLSQGNKPGNDSQSALPADTQPARLRQLFVLERTEGHWKIRQYMYQQMPEQ